MSTYYWDRCRLAEPELETARRALAAGAADPAAFLVLLRSGRQVPTSIALDCYSWHVATERWGRGNPFEPYEPEILARARDVLRHPPTPSSRTGAHIDGADHASALGAMLNLAEPQDAGLIADALERATTRDVLEAGAMAAQTAMTGTAEPSRRLVEVLGQIALDASRPAPERVRAVKSLYGVRSPRAARIAATATADDDLHLQTAAALVLAGTHLTTHRPLLERLASHWPPDAPYDAVLVRDFLSKADEITTT